MGMDWGDMMLRLIRAAGILASTAAGIAALFTEGALKRRTQAGWRLWKGTPLDDKHFTRWGAILFAVILIAPTVQFFGDWRKDYLDDQKLQDTSKQIRQDISETVSRRTNHLVNLVQREGGIQSEAAARAIAEIQNVATAANRIQTETERILQPLSDVHATFLLRVPLKDPELRGFSERFRAAVQPLISRMEAHPLQSQPVRKENKEFYLPPSIEYSALSKGKNARKTLYLYLLG